MRSGKHIKLKEMDKIKSPCTIFLSRKLLLTHYIKLCHTSKIWFCPLGS